MNSEDAKPIDAPLQSAVPVENISNTSEANTISRTPVERTVEMAREQANEAADAFRRGEFMREATVDTAANVTPAQPASERRIPKTTAARMRSPPWTPADE